MKKQKYALVLGAGGFIGSHLVTKLKKEGFWVRGVDLKYPEYSATLADEFIIGDLRDQAVMSLVMFSPIQQTMGESWRSFDEVYQLAADMGGAAYVFGEGEHDSDIMSNSVQINLNTIHKALKWRPKKIFYSSSACIYPAHNQIDPENPNCVENSAYPAAPDSEYGWEKIFSERMYMANARNHGLNIRIARFHNIYGPEGTWDGGREKAPAAICRKISQAKEGEEVEIWGDGLQTRSFMYIDECLEAVRKFMDSDFQGPLNIGSDEMITINDLTKMVAIISGKNIVIKNIPGPTGVRGRNSDNTLIEEILKWRPSYPLINGMKKTYDFVNSRVHPYIQ